MTGTYNLWMVALSLVVASLASYTALDLATRITSSQGRAAKIWLAIGAVSMGTGIWSMHFIGMLAFSLPIPMGYDIPVTLASMAIAVVVSGFALFIVTRATLGYRNLIVSAILMGLGICAMHYTGMAAMETSPPIEYDAKLFAASVGIAIGAAFAALWIAFTLRSDALRYAKPLSALVMGLAITGMHYTGMAAAQFAPDTVCLSGPSVDNSWLAGTIAGVTFLILCVTLVLSLLDARHASETARMTVSLQKANADLMHQALHDGLTKLPNRTLLEDRIDQTIEECKRAQGLCAVLFVDLDRFKVINDSLGHFVGDEVLKSIAERLRNAVRAEDTVSRLGGDEFVILLRHVLRADDAIEVAQKVANSVGTPIRVLHHDIFVSPSIGVTLYPPDASTSTDLIKRADAAMYHVKKSGRNGVQRFSSDMETFYPERVSLESDLRNAIARQELELFYQPKVDVRGGSVSGVEALIRWRHPTRGLVLPMEFIPMAEETGLIIPIGEWVLKRACAQTKRWQELGFTGLKVAVNISGVQWRQNDLVEIIAAALHDSGLEPSCLELELTETVVMHNAAEAIRMLDRLHAMGVRLSIDDFGTGYSSLAYLKRFPLNSLKIDRAFVSDLATDPDDALITLVMINMAHNLKLDVIAEGVENEAQLNFLRSHGCDVIQGYYFSKPLDERACGEFLAQGPRPFMSLEPGLSKPTLLLVDDNEDDLAILERIWLDDFRVLKACDVANAYETLAREPVAVVVSDYHMQDENGVEFLANVRKLYPSTARILSTLTEDFSLVSAAINEAGIHGFLSKNWSAERLRVELHDTYRRRTAVRPRVAEARAA